MQEIKGWGGKDKGIGWKMWNECVKVDIKSPGLVKYDGQNQDKWRSLTTENRPTLPQRCNYLFCGWDYYYGHLWIALSWH